jgi:CO dehydrogenase/acetyl-CoA synthase beta subunit
MRRFLADREEKVLTHPVPCDLTLLESEFGYEERGKANADVILSDDTAVELGHPSTVSHAIVLSSYQPELIRHGQISIVGPDLDEIERGDRRPFGQVVMLGLRPGEAADPFGIDNAQYLIRRLPGYMVRSVPGRLWARISYEARESGLTLETVGSALIAAYTRDFPAVEKAEVAFVTSCQEDVESLAEIANEAKILSGKHKKLVLGVDGEVECMDLNCEACDDKPICDDLRDIVIKRRRGRQ